MGASLATGSGTTRAAYKERGHDLYETPDCAIRALLAVERIPRTCWEPACGPGAIVRVLRDYGRAVIATDLVDWGCPDSKSGIDFLMERKAPPGVHALTLVPEVYMLLRGGFLEGLRWYRPGESRHGLGFRDHLARVWMFAPRLPFMHRRGYTGKKNSNSGMPFAWYVFHHDAARFNAAQVRWLNPRDYGARE